MVGRWDGWVRDGILATLEIDGLVVSGGFGCACSEGGVGDMLGLGSIEW